MPSLYWLSGHDSDYCADKMVKCISRLAVLYLFQILCALHYPASHLPSFQAVAVDAGKSIMSLSVDPIGLPRTPPIDGRPLSARASVSPLATMIRRVWPHGPRRARHHLDRVTAATGRTRQSITEVSRYKKCRLTRPKHHGYGCEQYV